MLIKNHITENLLIVDPLLDKVLILSIFRLSFGNGLDLALIKEITMKLYEESYIDVNNIKMERNISFI
ncbi:MAG: hypothetical protein ACQERB_09155 [Promethearchaeati archaeon]